MRQFNKEHPLRLGRHNIEGDMTVLDLLGLLMHSSLHNDMTIRVYGIGKVVAFHLSSENTFTLIADDNDTKPVG